MKKFRFLATAALAAMMLGACTDDKLDGPENGGPINPDAEEGVFFTIDIDLPEANGNASRSTTEDEDKNGETTSSAGVEIGKDYENKVTEAIVVLSEQVKGDDGKTVAYNFIAAAPVNTASIAAVDGEKAQYRVLSKFSKTQLQSYYNLKGTTGDAKSISAAIFVFCNPTAGLRSAIFGDETKPGAELGKPGWVDAIGEVTAGSQIWTANNFLMSNSTIAVRSIPAKIEDWNYYTIEGNPFSLSDYNQEVDIHNEAEYDRGPVRVQRAAARFDFRDGSEDGLTDETLNGIGENRYEVLSINLEANKAETPKVIPTIDIQLNKMALVNVGRKFYFLKRVSKTVNPVDPELCTAEKKWNINENGTYEEGSGNYVVDADWDWKTTVYNTYNGNDNPTGITPDYFSKNLLYPFFSVNEKTGEAYIDNTNVSKDAWDSSIIENVLDGTNDNPVIQTGIEKPDEVKDGYKIWRYATENTIPGVNEQINGVSTGVVFKGKILVSKKYKDAVDALSAEDKELYKDQLESLDAITKALEDDKSTLDSWQAPILYSYAGNLYLKWEGIRKAALNAAQPEMKWIPESEADPSKGKWELVYINRDNSLYKAVFGNGGFGKMTFRFKSQTTGKYYTAEYTDELAGDETSANAAWEAWNAKGKPSEGPEKDNFKEKVTEANITIYQRSKDTHSGWGYYCYYYYWNRHNNNNKDGVMGPMEFAVVRNNVYKLAVTNISRLGHPRLSENDPEKPGPGTPDESEDVYITVKAQVIPWVVRVNNIKF